MFLPCEECGIRPPVEGGGGLCEVCDEAANLSDFDDREPLDECDEDEEYCHHCGKPLEDFADVGCEYCDVRYFDNE